MPIIVGIPIGGGGLPAPADGKIRPASPSIDWAASVPTIPKTVTFTAPSAMAFAVTAPTITSPGGFPSVSNVVWRLRAGALAGIDGDLVSTWTDASGNGRDFTASGSQRPTLKTGIVNGKNVVRFNGANIMSASAVNLSATSTVTLYAVIGNVTRGEVDVVLEHSADYNAGAGRFIFLQLDSPAIPRASHHDASLYSSFNNANDRQFPTSGFSLYRVLFDTAAASNEVTIEQDHLVSGTRPENSNTTGPFSTQTQYLGARSGPVFGFTGDMAELVLIAADPSSGDKTALDAYFLAEYGV